MEQCKNCGEEVQVREIVREVEKRVEVGDRVFWLRFWRAAGVVIVLMTAIIAGAVSYSGRLENEELKMLLEDPEMTIRIQELPNSQPIREFTKRLPK